MQLHKLNKDDLDMRKAIVICAGNLTRTAELLGWNRCKVYNRLARKKHRLWWLKKKKLYSRLRRNERDRRWRTSVRMQQILDELNNND